MKITFFNKIQSKIYLKLGLVKFIEFCNGLNLTLILGSILVSFTIAFGLGARDVVLRLLFGFYSRRNFEVGQHIKTKKIEGVIQQIDNICITIKTEDTTVVLPIKKFVDQKIEIL